MGAASFHLAKHFVDGCERRRSRKVPELLDGGGFGVGSRRPEVSDGQRLLEIQTAGNDLAEKARDVVVAQRPLVLLLEPRKDLGFPLRPIEHRRLRIRVRLLDLTHLQRAGSPLK